MEDNGDSDSTAAAARAKEFMTVEHWLHWVVEFSILGKMIWNMILVWNNKK